MLKIKNVGEKSSECISLLEKMFMDRGTRPLDPEKKMKFWSMESSENSLLGEPVLSMDEAGNELRAVFFVTRKEKCKKTELFRFTELFDALPTIEKDIAITEVLEIFAEERREYLRPTSVVCLGSVEEEGIRYQGCFLLNVPLVDKTEIYPEEELHIQTSAELKKIEETEEKYNWLFVTYKSPGYSGTFFYSHSKRGIFITLSLRLLSFHLLFEHNPQKLLR